MFRQLDHFLPHPARISETIGEADDTRTFGPVTVPKGRLWVMGDHRGDSADSRYHCGDGGPGPNCDPVDSTVPVSHSAVHRGSQKALWKLG